ncbi:hypothetical protein ACPPVS_03900 [Cellulomonas sp. McL0617]|uniref:hypothetical protein n=1 Tax=Cellulomonas sp. McL0617 TaxID=3415675 RepID=UPI003CF84D2F
MTSQTTVEPSEIPTSPKPARGSRLLGLLVGAALAAGVVTAAIWLSHGSHQDATAAADAAVPVSWGREAVTADGLVARSGVRIVGVTVTGAGGLVDLRYQVVDPDTADALHDPANPPAVVDEETGLVVHDLFMNHSHSGQFKAGETYYLVFDNPNGWIHTGSVVTVLLGDAQVDHVVVG